MIRQRIKLAKPGQIIEYIMNILEKIKENGIKKESKNVMTLCNSVKNGFLLGFKRNDKEAFLIENPTLKNIEEITLLLNTEDSNFLYLESAYFDRLYITRKDRSQFNHTLFANDEILTGIVTSKNSVDIIAQRFLENSLFDDRENEKRYLLKKNWYNYSLEDAEPYYLDPLYDLPIDMIGIWRAQKDIWQIYFPGTIDYSIPFFMNELKPDNLNLYHSVPPTENHFKTIESLESTLGISLYSPVYLNNGILVHIPRGKETIAKLKKRSFTYRHLDYWGWYIYAGTNNKKQQEYTVSLDLVVEERELFLEIRGIQIDLLHQMAEMLFNSDSGMLAIARPMRFKENKAKSIIIEYSEDKLIISDKSSNINTKSDLLALLNNWLD